MGWGPVTEKRGKMEEEARFIAGGLATRTSSKPAQTRDEKERNIKDSHA